MYVGICTKVSIVKEYSLIPKLIKLKVKYMTFSILHTIKCADTRTLEVFQVKTKQIKIKTRKKFKYVYV